MEKEEDESAQQKQETSEEPKTTSSLFPVSPQFSISAAAGAGAVPEWLRNSSFTTNLSVINDSLSAHHRHAPFQYEDKEEEEEEVDKGSNKERAQYELLDSSASDRGPSSSPSDEERDNRRKRRMKKRKRRRERSADARKPYEHALFSSRKPDVGSWASSSAAAATNDRDYYFDSRGDRDNLAFGCLYKMDVARYKLHNTRKTFELNYCWRNHNSIFDPDGDVDAFDSKLRAEGRYWSAKYAAVERHKNLKRTRIFSHARPQLKDSVDFIPLIDEGSGGESVSGATVVEESWEDEIFCKTKEFNKMTRERPQDEKIWLDFADFQDKVASMQPHKGARLQILEKKISILEKATELNPDSEDLLLSLMNAYQSRDSIDVLISRWERILLQNSDSYTLWREFLRFVQGEFSRFKVSEMRKIYANAVQALSGACSKQHRQVCQGAMPVSLDPAIVKLEVGLVDIFMSLCRFEWQAGYKELATALFQAEIEYSLFSPSLLLSKNSKQRLFEHFWSSNGARVGEDGALGWSTWLEKEEEQRQRAVEESSTNVDEGGWTGWSEPLSKIKEINEVSEKVIDSDGVLEELEDGAEMQEADEKDDTEALLKMLGIDAAAAEVNGEVKDTRTWARWSEEEVERDSDQWMPVRANCDDDQLLRVIEYEDVSDYLFSIYSKEARLSLVSQFIDFYGGRMTQWTCTNSSTWVEKTLSLEALTDPLLDELRVNDFLTKSEGNPVGISLEHLLSSANGISMRTNMMKFLRNASLLCMTVFPQNFILEEAALVAEELSNTMMNSSSCSVTPCRVLAKSLLKSNRQDILLCGVYAQREAVFGNIDHARKIFDMALSSIEGLPVDVRRNESLLYLWYAEVELANFSHGSPESLLRALHILSCLGSGVKYTPYKCQPSSLLQLRARQGFRERINLLRSTWTRGGIDDQSVALVCSAALFEEISIGWRASAEIFDQAFSMVLPERRRNSYHVESLFNYYVAMLSKHHREVKLSKVWQSILNGLQMYPFSPKLYSALVQISHLYTSPNKLRLVFDEYCKKKPSVINWLFALSFEISRGGSQHRIRRLFERALEDEKLRNSVIIWRSYITYEHDITCNASAARRVFFRAVHACP
ncbi:PREDICTED: protein NRDE2 homolog isoform X2 [Ipomoea nil]|nr:PREDICTED: protein NRDE2 homolog isoform X2 [Ipomoea nil]